MTRPTLIPGERRILHGGDYNPDQWRRQPEIIDEDFRLMPLAGCQTFSVGIFSWTHYEAEEGVFDFGWLDRIMDRMAAQGQRVILATPSGAKPAWMSVKYPEIRRVDRRGVREHYQGRHNHCWTSPIYRAKVREINTRLAERYASHPALGMWHLSNEYSGACFCELCLDGFRQWLKARYGTLDELNHAWWTGFWSHTYTDWNQIEPDDAAVDGLELDWKRFNTWQTADFIEWESEPLRRLTPGVPRTTNFMGLFPPLDYSTLAEHIDLIADDQYPRYNPADPNWVRSAAYIALKNDVHRCMKPDRPWMLMESVPDAVQWSRPQTLKRPNVHRTEMLQALAHGAEGTLYFQWRKGRGGMEKQHGAVVDHVGHEHTRVFRTVADLGKLYTQLGDLVGTEVKAEVGLIYDWEVRWAFELTDGSPCHQDAYSRTALDYFQTLWARGIPVDAIRSDRPFEGYKLLIAPILWMLRPGVAEQIRAYVEAGGTVVATYGLGTVDNSNRVWFGGLPGDGLREVFGIWNEELDTMSADAKAQIEPEAGNTLGLSHWLTIGDARAILHVEGASVLARYTDQFYAGTPAITENTFGQGRAIYVGARLEYDSLVELMGLITAQVGVEPVVKSDLPAGVSVGKRGDFLIVQNFTNEPVEVDLGEPYTNVESSVTARGVSLEAAESVVLRRA